MHKRLTQWRERIEIVDDEEALNLPVYPEHEDKLEFVRREGETLVPKDSASDAGGWVAADALMKLFQGLTSGSEVEKTKVGSPRQDMMARRRGTLGGDNTRVEGSQKERERLPNERNSQEPTIQDETKDNALKPEQGKACGNRSRTPKKSGSFAREREHIPSESSANAVIDRDSSAGTVSKRKHRFDMVSPNKSQKKQDGSKAGHARLGDTAPASSPKLPRRSTRVKPSVKDIFLGKPRAPQRCV
jgi:hypothetical protein